MSSNLTDDLKRAVEGDADAIVLVSQADDRSMREAAERLGVPLVVNKAALANILQGLIDGRFSPSAVQAWASFVRRGYVGGTANGPIKPIDIEFEVVWEDAIAAVVSRLDEIGDVIDGEVTARAAHGLLHLPGE